jgi:hypothetical protein
VPEVLNPEIVPGGLLDAGQWRHAQDALQAIVKTLNLVINYIGNQQVPTPPPPGWAGLALEAFNTGTYNLLPDDNFISVFSGNDTTPTANPALWQFNLPLASQSNGPITFLSVNSATYTVNAHAGDTIDIYNYYAAVLPSFTTVTTLVEGLTGATGEACWAVYSRDHDISTRWIRTRLNLRGIN